MANMHMKLGNPLLIGIYSLALLLIGAAIGARWGHSPHTAVWMAVLGAALMVAHDMLTGAIFFLVSAAWALRSSRQREIQARKLQEHVAQSELQHIAKVSGRNRTKRRD